MKTSARIFSGVLLFTLIIFSSCSEDTTGPEDASYNWPTSTPEDQGIDSQLLTQAISQGENLGFVDCILVIRNGYIVAENYYNGYGENIPHDVRSVSKSFLSAMIGIALRDGHLDSLGSKMLDFFPEYVYQSIDPRKFDITIRHLLMMRMGIDSDENIYNQVYNSSNWVKTTIELPLLHNPGSKFLYSTYQTHLLSAIITKASGMSTMEFARRFLLSEMKIECNEWQQDAQGYYFGGNSMDFTPRNMARLGYLYMNNGNLNGKQIVPAEWVEESLINYTGFNGLNWGDLHNFNYGYLWWLGEIKDHQVFLALGHGGQFILNFPDLNLIVVATADWKLDWDIADQHERAILSIVANYIVPAVNP
jgi:CubicO group peptidase (beta-lactamase class C family)